MNNNYIEFKKKRELGDIITDTFAFLRQNAKPLFSVLTKTTSIAFLLLLTAAAYYTMNISNLFDPVNIQNDGFQNIGEIFIPMVFMLATLVLFYVLLFGTVLHYINSYITNKGAVDEEAVKQGVRNDFGNILGLGIIAATIIFFGIFLCIIPGIYLYVPMSLVLPILVFKGSTISEAINESFKLIKGEWWITFATLFIIGILVSLISFVFSLPATIYTLTDSLVASDVSSMADPSDPDWVLIGLNVISHAAQFILYIITAVATAFIYFNLNERKNASGTLEKIDSLGKTE